MMVMNMFLLKSFIKIQIQSKNVLVLLIIMFLASNHQNNLSFSLRVIIEKYWIQLLGIHNLKLFEISWKLKCTLWGKKKKKCFLEIISLPFN